MVMRAGVGFYCAAVGLFMVVWWILDINRGALARPDWSRAQINLRLAAKVVTGVLLAAGGALLICGVTSSVALVGLAALLFTVIARPGYFSALNERAPAIMFGLVLMLTLGSMGGVLAA
jgi:hypothetical protein